MFPLLALPVLQSAKILTVCLIGEQQNSDYLSCNRDIGCKYTICCKQRAMCSDSIVMVMNSYFPSPLQEEATTCYQMRFLKTYTSTAMRSACSCNWATLLSQVNCTCSACTNIHVEKKIFLHNFSLILPFSFSLGTFYVNDCTFQVFPMQAVQTVTRRAPGPQERNTSKNTMTGSWSNKHSFYWEGITQILGGWDTPTSSFKLLTSLEFFLY